VSFSEERNTFNRKLFLFFVLFLSDLFFVSGGDLKVKADFNPPVFFVGDTVDLIITISGVDSPEVKMPSELPSPDWLDIKNIKIKKDSDTVTVTVSFVSFAPGTRELPPLDLGNIKLRNIKIPTRSILREGVSGGQRIKGQLLIPGTRLGLAVILALSAAVPFFMIFLYKLVRKAYYGIIELIQNGRPSRRIKRLLRKLASELEKTDKTEWYSMLTEGLRAYLVHLTGNDCISLTTAEIASLTWFKTENGVGNNFIRVLEEGDMVKFAGKTVTAEDQRFILNLLGETVDKLEKNNDKS